MSFYVTLPSHANRKEFPNNQVNWFKNRIPHPLRLTDGNWQVGLSSISIPDKSVHLTHFFKDPEHYLWGMGCYYKDSTNTFVAKNVQIRMTDLKKTLSIVDGVSFMKAILYYFDKQFTELYQTKYGYTASDTNKTTIPIFKWEGEDVLLDNAKAIRKTFPNTGDVKWPYVAFNIELGKHMGWFIYDQTRKAYKLGPNLLMIFNDEKTPAKSPADFTDRPGNPLFFTTKKVADGTEWMWLDMRLSWKFLNLNVAFCSVVKEPTRSLHVYSDVGSSSMVGNKMTDLLREIKYQREGRGSVYFEPFHIHYVPVRNQVTEIIEVQVAETLGTGEDLVKFGDGHTILTLHFQKM